MRSQVITDGAPVKIWPALDTLVTAAGFPSILAKFKVPKWLMLAIAWASQS